MTHPLILLPLLAGAVYPPHTDNHLNDFAGVIKPAEAERIRERAKAVLQAQGVPIVVATIRSLAEQDAAGWSIERYATNLYNEWGIGERATNRGVLLLVSVRDRKLRIATGSGLGNYDDRARRVIDGTIVPKLKSGDLSGGIAAGVEAIAGWFDTARALAPEDGLPPGRVPGGEGAGWSPHGTGVIRKTERGGGISNIFKVFLLVIGIALVFSILRRRSPDMGGSYGRRHGGGWGSFLMGGLAGFLGSQLLSGGRRGSQWSGGSAFGGGSGGSSFGGGFSSGGGASGSW